MIRTPRRAVAVGLLSALTLIAVVPATAAWRSHGRFDPSNSFAGVPAYAPGPDCGFYDENGAPPGYGYTYTGNCRSRLHIYTPPYTRHDVWR